MRNEDQVLFFLTREPLTKQPFHLVANATIQFLIQLGKRDKELLFLYERMNEMDLTTYQSTIKNVGG